MTAIMRACQMQAFYRQCSTMVSHHAQHPVTRYHYAVSHAHAHCCVAILRRRGNRPRSAAQMRISAFQPNTQSRWRATRSAPSHTAAPGAQSCCKHATESPTLVHSRHTAHRAQLSASHVSTALCARALARVPTSVHGQYGAAPAPPGRLEQAATVTSTSQQSCSGCATCDGIVGRAAAAPADVTCGGVSYGALQLTLLRARAAYRPHVTPLTHSAGMCSVHATRS